MSWLKKYYKVDLRFVWAQARLNVADLNSKIHGDVVQLTNGEKWRHGPKEFRDRDYMEKHTFLTFDKTTRSFIPTSNVMPSIKDDEESCSQGKVSTNNDASTPESLTTKISTVQLRSQPVKSERNLTLDKVKVSETPHAVPSAGNSCLTLGSDGKATQQIHNKLSKKMQDHTASTMDVSTASQHEQGKDNCLLNSQDVQAHSAYASTACDAPDTGHSEAPDLQSTQYAPNMDTTGELVTMSQEYLY